jgi:hypothetical protein
MDPDLITLGAYVDGELAPEEMARIAMLVDTRPDIAMEVAHLRALHVGLQGAMEPVSNEPVPERLLDAVRNTPASPLWRLREWSRDTIRGFFARPALSLGAALACGLVIGLVMDRGDDGLLSGSSGRIVAQGALAKALDEQLASAGYGGTGPRIGTSFQNKNGQDCRTFTIPSGTVSSGDAASAGIACRDSALWVVGTLAPAPKPSTSPDHYGMAGSDMPDLIREAATAMMAGSPFDAQAERKARDHHWNSQ